MAGTTALPLQEFIASLDDTCLPKLLQVCSGVYFQGSFLLLLLLLFLSEMAYTEGQHLRDYRLLHCCALLCVVSVFHKFKVTI